MILLPVLSFAQPSANFSANVISGCSPIVVQFTDQSTGSPNSWAWNLGNGSNSTLQNPSTTYILPGTYTVTLTATNVGGSNTKTVTNYITVYPSPTVGFVADSTLACPPKSIQFTNQTIAGAPGTVTYLWDFGDGNTSSLANPSHTYTTAANFTVTLLATNSSGCSQSLTKPGYIPMSAKPQLAFNAPATSACTPPFTTTFNNATVNAVSYQWDFGDGQTSTLANPSHTYANTGSYSVRLIATNATGCKDTLVKTNFITIGALNGSFTVNDSTICTGTPVTFTNTTAAGFTNVTWLFGDGNSSTAASPTYTYNTAGSYTAKLIVQQNSCIDTVAKTITVAAKPVSQFTTSTTQSCNLPFTPVFSNTSTGATSYLWLFGDGTTSTLANPSKTYTTEGMYTVKLVAYNAAGCTDTQTRTNYITVQPMYGTLFADIMVTPPPGCAPASVALSGGQTGSLLFGITSYAWNYGNGNNATTSTPNTSQTYTTPGSYTVSLTYTTIPGCTFTKQTTIVVGSKPTASFSTAPDTVCPNVGVSFNNTTVGATSYKWYFGDGDSSSLATPTHIYLKHGNYTVRLVAFNGGCADTFTVSNRVIVKLPTAHFVPLFNCANRLFFTFADSSVGANTYLWKFGDGQTSTQSGTVTHQYAAYGTYFATLIVTNAATGCIDSFNRTIFAHPLSAQFSAADTTICKNQSASFTGSVVPHASNYAWHLGNGGFVNNSGNTLLFNYANAGIYTVKFVVTDSMGCKDSMVRTNYMRVGGPIAAFSATPVTGCAPLNTMFTDQSASAGGAIASRIWQFGDNTNTTTGNATISHVYNTGTYSVKLIVTDVIGCLDSVIKTNHITASKAIASFYSNDTSVCPGQLVNFVNTSNSASVLWYFGDGQTSTSYSIGHAYSTPGNYTVKMVVSDANGCKDSMTKTAYIKVLPLAVNFTMSDSFANCPPLTVNFTAGSGLNNYTWTFGNSSQSSLANATTIYTYPGIYTVKLIAQNSVGCSDSATKTVTVLGPTGTLSYTPVSGCKPLTIAFSSTNSNTQSLIWDMSNGVTQTTPANSGYTYIYTQAGKYIPKLILSDGGSCLVPITGMDTIKVDSLGADFSFAPASLCQAGTVQFTDTIYYSLSGTTTRSWIFGDGGTSTAHNPAHTYVSPGTYQVKLVVGNSAGCTDTIIKQVVIHAQPNVSAGNNAAICIGQSSAVTLQATGASTYSWSPATGLSCSNCANPTAYPSATTIYTVIGTDNNGCKDTNTVTVTVNALPNVTGGAHVAICQGDSAQLQAAGATSYTWSPATGLSCSNCSNPKASPAATTQYIVTGTDANGCTDTGIVTVTVNALPNVTATVNKVICAGDSAQLQATGAVTYSWAPATGLSCTTCANPKASPAATTVYTVTGTNANGCIDTAKVTVTVNALPNVTAGNNQSICAGGSATLQATGGTSYVWSPATGLSCTNCANPTASPSVTTTYIVTGTNANGCTDTGIVTVTVYPLPTVSASANQSICIGSSAQLQATGASTYSWSPATGLSCISCANPVANPVATTTYTVTGTSANGCVNTSQVTVTINAQPTVTAGNSVSICTGKSVALQAAGAASYTWSPAAGLSCTNCANPTASPAATITYSVIGTGSNGCSDTAQVTVTVNPLPTISAGAGQSICAGGSAPMQASGGVSYVWSPAVGLSCTSCGNPTATPATTTTYTVTGTNANGCTNTATITVTVNPIPTVTATTGNNTICEGASTSLQASGAGSYTWSPATGLSCTNCANPTASPATTTTYIVTGTSNGCTDTAHINITVLPKPVINVAGSTSICAGNSASLIASGAQSFIWSPATALSCTICPNPVATPSATTTYTVTGTDANGCTNSKLVTVTVHQSPDIDAGADKSLCYGASVKLNATGGTNYVWSPANNLSCTNCSSPSANPLKNETYKVVGTDAFGCSDSDEVTITVIEKTPVSISPDVTICEGESTELSANGGTSYQWFPSAGLANDNTAKTTASPSSTTVYNVIVKQGDCFADTGTIKVEVHGNPTVDAGPDQNAVAGNTIQLNALGTGIVKYEWQPADKLSCANCQNPAASAMSTTTFEVTATNQWGCTAKDDITVFITCDANQLFIANTFTPNSDGINDRFYPQGKGITSIKRFRVFNRWGEIVFDASNIPLNDPNYGWDGHRNQAPLKPDVFVYIINATCESGEPIEIKGDISLVR